MTEILAYGNSSETHQRVLSESYVMNTNMTGFRCFTSLHLCALDESSLSIGRVNISLPIQMSDEIY